MNLPLSHREIHILEIIQDLGSPHALEIMEEYHRRHQEPLPVSILLRTLRPLVEEGYLLTRNGPAPPEANFDKLVHFRLAPEISGLRFEVLSKPPETPLQAKMMELVRLMQAAADRLATESDEPEESPEWPPAELKQRQSS